MHGSFNVIDFMGLPPVERCLVRLVLRETSVTDPQLWDAVRTLPPDQQFDQRTFDSALDHLIDSGWLVGESSDRQIVYRVNTQDNLPRESQDVLESPDMANLSTPASLLSGTSSEEQLLSGRGKRILPTRIWDSLTDPAPEKPLEPPKRRPSLFDKFVEESSHKPNEESEKKA